MLMTKRFAYIAALLCLLASCAGIDCPLNNTVQSHWSFYSQGKPISVSDSIYVFAKVNGADSLVINRLYNATDMEFPLSYYNDVDTFRIEFHQPDGKGGAIVMAETILISKDNLEHFNSPECGVWHEHRVKELRSTTLVIDSIQTVRLKIDTNEQENFRIHFK